MTLRSPEQYARQRGRAFRTTSYAWGEPQLCECGETFVQLAAYQCCRACWERKRLPRKGER